MAEAAAKPEHQKFVAALVKDLQAHKGAAVVIPGDNQPPAVHALAHAMNQALGAAGNTVIYTDPVEAKPQDQTAALKELVGEMNAGKVDLLLIMGSNPVYDAPADFDFADAMNKVPLRVQHSLYQDETSDHVHWHINATHYLEAVGRRPGLRRDVQHRAAADRAAVQRQERVRIHLFAGRLAGDRGLRHRSQVLAGQDAGRRFRDRSGARR